MIKPNTKINFTTLDAKKPRVRRKKLGKRFTADEWLTAHFEDVIDKYGTGGRYILIADNVGIVFTDKDGSPRELVLKAKKLYPDSSPLFFLVPKPKDFICVLIVR